MSFFVPRKSALGAACAIAVGCTVASWALATPLDGRSTGDPVSPIIFPEQLIPLRFSHFEHLTKKKLDCGYCHEAAETSRSSLDNLIPTEEECAECHEIDRNEPFRKVAAGRPAANCLACHPGFRNEDRFVARVRIPIPNIKFSHKAHADRKIRCRTCHGDFVDERVELATRDQLPKMGLCLGCHDGKRAPSACTTCHLADPGGFVRTDYGTEKLLPSGILRGDGHDMMFRTSHQSVANNDSRYCGTCHRKEFCVECHNGVVKPMDFHGNDYVTVHPIEARRNSPDCSACHRQQTFCVGCHARSGVTVDDRSSDFSGGIPPNGIHNRRFHPPGWAESSAAGRAMTHHAYDAQRNIRQCASCHREDFCVGCHSAQPGNLRINPHPNKWANSARCEALAKRTGRMCLRCHVDAGEARCDRQPR